LLEKAPPCANKHLNRNIFASPGSPGNPGRPGRPGCPGKEDYVLICFTAAGATQTPAPSAGDMYYSCSRSKSRRPTSTATRITLLGAYLADALACADF